MTQRSASPPRLASQSALSFLTVHRYYEVTTTPELLNYLQIMMASLISVLVMATVLCLHPRHQVVGAMSDTAPRRMLLQGEARGVISDVRECTNTYLSMKALSDSNSERLTFLEAGNALNTEQLNNLTERIALTSADLVRTSVNISEMQMTYSTLFQDLLLFTSDMLGLENDVVQSQAQLDALQNIQTVNQTTYDLRVYSASPGNEIASSDIFVSEAACPSGLRPIKVDCEIQNLLESSFIDVSITNPITGPPSQALFRQDMDASSGTCAYQVYYIDADGVQQDIAYASTTVPPIAVTTTVACRAA